MFKYYTADTYREHSDGMIYRVGSRIVRVWFWQNPIAAYNKLGATGSIPVSVRRIK